MAQTPDHRPGVPGYEDLQTIYTDNATSYPTVAGAQAYGNGSFRFQDGVGVYDPRYVYQLTHTTLADFAHVATNGPAGVNAYRTITYLSAAPAIRAQVVWWTDSTQTARYWDLTYTWASGQYVTPQAKLWQLYAPGTTVLYRIRDTLTLSGAREVARQRTYTAGP